MLQQFARGPRTFVQVRLISRRIEMPPFSDSSWRRESDFNRRRRESDFNRRRRESDLNCFAGQRNRNQASSSISPVLHTKQIRASQSLKGFDQSPLSIPSYGSCAPVEAGKKTSYFPAGHHLKIGLPHKLTNTDSEVDNIIIFTPRICHHFCLLIVLHRLQIYDRLVLILSV
jgi:hypothetical protein